MCFFIVFFIFIGFDFGFVYFYDIDDELNIVEKMELFVGDVKGKVVIFIDDMIDIGYIVRLVVGVLRENGVKEVYVLVSYGKYLFYIYYFYW